ncbi:response regulator [Permianibacter aggregans]|uniref:histidine kinase n=1 Tax=Permianibacter aggregans TaxID=1510150 RepID=A0A4V6PWR9_9GAMM|nr:response regulator [Permianibacter aggregans]QGX40061.1 response regulator [Permianibacter aggregans]TDQ49127.1 PAS domain S-box-containing protein [Permianibacter aggregans]
MESATAHPNHPPAALKRAGWVGLLVFLVLAIPVTLIWQRINSDAIHEQQQRFDDQVESLASTLENQMQLYELMLRGVGTLLLNSDDVPRSIWNRAIEQLHIQNRYPGIQGVGWARYLSQHERDSFVQQMRTNQQPDFRYFPAGDRPHYLLIEHLAPEDWRNQRALGFDMYSEVVRRNAIDAAIESGMSRMSGPVILVQETEQDIQTGTLLYVPLYRPMPDAEPDATSRRAHFIGTVYSPFRMSDFVQNVLGAQLLMYELKLLDQQSPQFPLFNSISENYDSHFQHTSSLQIFGRHWQLQARSSPTYDQAMAPTRNWYTLSLGLFASLLSALLVAGYLYTRERALQAASLNAAAVRDREQLFVSLLMQSPVATAIVNEQENIEIANTRFADLLSTPAPNTTPDWLQRLPLADYFRQLQLSGPGLLEKNLRIDLPVRDQTIAVELSVAGLQHGSGQKLVLSFSDLTEHIESEERLKEIIEASPNAILLINEQGLIELVNQQTEQLLGYRREQLIGQTVDQLVPDSVRPHHPDLRARYFRQPVRTHIGANRDLYAKHQSGRLIPVEIGLSALTKSGRHLVQAVLVDISARKDATQKLEKQAQELEELNRYKSEFLANMSHELRTPLNSILILSDQLRSNKEKTLSEKQIFHADIIHRAGQDLLALINDILDLSKIEAGKMSLQKSPHDIRDLLEELQHALQPLAESRGLLLNLNIGKEVPSTVLTDRARLAQILRNLISNAIKFTEKGHVSVTVMRGMMATPGFMPSLEFRVLDTGIGIAPEKLQEVFGAFNQIDSGTQRKSGGTGLGLTISRQLAQLFGGEILVESVPGQGSVFTLQIPLETVSPPELQSSARRITTARDQPAILIVEDDSCFASVLCEFAEQYGYQCEQTSEGNEALKRIGQRVYAGVLIDLLLPDISGWQVLRALQANPAYRDVPVQIISCLPEPHDWFDERVIYLLKPVGRESLHQLFKRIRVSNKAEQHNVLLVEDVELEREHYASLLQELGFAVVTCADAEQALNAYRQQRFDAVIMDLRLPDASGYELLQQMNELRSLDDTALVINTGADLSAEELSGLRELAALIVHKAGTDTENLKKALRRFFTDINNEPESKPPKTTLQPIAPHITGAADSPSMPKVLIVDDDARNIISLEAMLSDYQLRLLSVNSGVDALRLLVHQHIDLILMDIAMAGMDGYATIEAIKAQKLSSARIIALTAHAMKGDRERCIEAGADDYLAKPVNRRLLTDTMRRYIAVERSSERTGKTDARVD